MEDQLLFFQQRLVQHGHRLTQPRHAILEALLLGKGHITADQLANQLREQGSGIGRMTVYRTLELLMSVGLIRPIYQGTGAAHYVILHHGHHHHLICQQCEQTIEFNDCVLQELSQVLSARFNFQIESHLLEFYGHCDHCTQIGEKNDTDLSH